VKLIAALPEAVCRKTKNRRVRMLRDRADEGAPVRAAVRACQRVPVVPPKRNRKKPWRDDRELYRRRNEVERYFRRLKEFRRVFTRYDKLDAVYSAFVMFAMTCELLRQLT
jgi:transposase